MVILNSNIIDSLIREKVITNEEISFLFTISNVEFFNNFKENSTYKSMVLKQIYIDPKTIYSSKLIDEGTTDKLVDFVIRKYNIEKEEMKYRLLEGEISQQEYNNYINKLEEFLFPEDSVVAKNIKRIKDVRNRDKTLNKHDL